jgi:hypothetical protein
VECAAVPFEARRAFGVSGYDKEPMRMLWRDVAARMTLDACGYTNFSKADAGEYREHLKAIGEAHNWFRFDSDDVEEVFDLAGIDHRPVVTAILGFINTKDVFNE